MSKRVIIIGAGLAGLTAAHAAAKQGATVLVVDRGPIGIGTNSALANGFFAGPSEKYSPEDYIRDTLRAGRGLNRESMVRLVAREAPSAFQRLRSTGVLLKERGAQRAVVSPEPSVIPGVALMRKLADLVKDLEGVHVLPGFQVTGLPCHNGRVCGVRGFNRMGEEMDIEAAAVVLAAGGAGAIYRRHDNQKKILGQGYALAARAGLELWDMEFVQFYPLVLADPRLPALIVYPPFAREAKLVDSSGRSILEKHGLGDVNDAIVRKRDSFSALLFEEAQAGGVFLDLREVPASAWDVHPLAIFKKLRFNFREKPVAVAPAVHFTMGGLRTGETCETDIGGLFACGEILWGLHGANRMGGNALTECVVSGAVAGRAAAERALGEMPVAFMPGEARAGSRGESCARSRRSAGHPHGDPGDGLGVRGHRKVGRRAAQGHGEGRGDRGATDAAWDRPVPAGAPSWRMPGPGPSCCAPSCRRASGAGRAAGAFCGAIFPMRTTAAGAGTPA